jgi:Flp pilus assembly protein TadG
MAPSAPKLRRPGEKGAEIVEFALIFATLMMLMLGIVEFARAYNVYQTITRAAREGARMAALPTSVYDSDAFMDPGQTTTQANSAVFANYIAPALQAANLNPTACTGSTVENCVSNYTEQVNWLDPTSSTDQEQPCGVIVSFAYPIQLSIPFLSSGLGTITLHARAQMRREDQPAPPVGGGSPTCGGNPLP